MLRIVSGDGIQKQKRGNSKVSKKKGGEKKGKKLPSSTKGREWSWREFAHEALGQKRERETSHFMPESTGKIPHEERKCAKSGCGGPEE